MSYWSCGYQGPPNEFVKDLHWLSAYYLKKQYGEVHLITDDCGALALNNFQWTSIRTDLVELDPSHATWFWAAGKLKTFQLAAQQGKPFLHVDYDVLLMNGLPDELNNASVIAQHPEDVVQSNYELDRVLPLIPNHSLFLEYPTPFAANTGVFGGNDLDFINTYVTEILDLAFSQENEILRTRKIYSHYGGASMFFEQYGLAVVAKKYGVNISYLFSGWPTPQEAKEKQYVHLMGAKRHTHVMEKISRIVAKLKSE
jgi:hypothetical protein